MKKHLRQMEEQTDTGVLTRVKKTPRGDQRRDNYSTSGSLDKQLGQKLLTGPPLSFRSLLTQDTVTAVNPQLLHSIVMSETYDAWYDNMMEPMFAANQFSSAQGLKILHFIIFPHGIQTPNKSIHAPITFQYRSSKNLT